MVLTRSQASDSNAQPRQRWPMPPAKRKAPPLPNDNQRAEDVSLVLKVAPVVPLSVEPLPVESLPVAPLPVEPLPVDPPPTEPPRARRKVSPPVTPVLIPENMEEGERFHASHHSVSDWVVIAIFFATIVACVLLSTSARASVWDVWLVPFANCVWACAVDIGRVIGFFLCEILQLICFETPQQNNTPWPDELIKNPQQ